MYRMNEYCCLSPEEWIESGVTISDKAFRKAKGNDNEETIQRLDSLENEKRDLELKTDDEFLKTNNLGEDYINYITTKVKHCYQLIPADSNLIPIINCYKVKLTDPLFCYCHIDKFLQGVQEDKRLFMSKTSKVEIKGSKSDKVTNVPQKGKK